MIRGPPDSALNTQLAAQPREETWGLLLPYQRGRMFGHRSRGEVPRPTITKSPALERRAAAAGRCTPRPSRGTLKDGRRRPKPCGSVESCCRRLLWGLAAASVLGRPPLDIGLGQGRIDDVVAAPTAVGRQMCLNAVAHQGGGHLRRQPEHYMGAVRVGVAQAVGH